MIATVTDSRGRRCRGYKVLRRASRGGRAGRAIPLTHVHAFQLRAGRLRPHRRSCIQTRQRRNCTSLVRRCTILWTVGKGRRRRQRLRRRLWRGTHHECVQLSRHLASSGCIEGLLIQGLLRRRGTGNPVLKGRTGGRTLRMRRRRRLRTKDCMN